MAVSEYRSLGLAYHLVNQTLKKSYTEHINVRGWEPFFAQAYGVTASIELIESGKTEVSFVVAWIHVFVFVIVCFWV